MKLKPASEDKSELTTVFRTHDITLEHLKFELLFELGRENFALSGTTVDTSRSRLGHGTRGDPGLTKSPIHELNELDLGFI